MQRLLPIFAGFAGFVGLALAGSANAQEQQQQPTPSPQLAELQARLDRLQQEVEQLKAHVAERSYDGLGLRFGGLSLRLGGYVQADAVVWRQDSVDELSPSTGDPLNQTRFLVRRARLRIEADYRFFGAIIELDGNTVNGPAVRIINAEASAWWPSHERNIPPYIMASLGLMRIPFGFEVQQRDWVRLFLERSNVVRALFPGEFDLGGRLQGGWRFVRYQFAVMNGHPVGELQFPGRSPTAAKDFLGRLGVDIDLRRRMNVTGGFSALYGTGFHSGTPGGKDVLVWRDINEDGIVQSTEIQVIGGVASQPSQDFGRWAVGADLEYRVAIPRLGELMLYGEIIWASNLDRGLIVSDSVAASRTLRQFGWYLAATLEVTDYAMVGLRYDRYNPDSDASERQGFSVVPRDLSFSTISAVAAARVKQQLRLVLEYDHNGNALGRSTTGLPTRLANDALTLRAQVAF